jgi:hypothetical protein
MEQTRLIPTLVVSSNYARHYIGPPDGNQAGSGVGGRRHFGHGEEWHERVSWFPLGLDSDAAMG